MVDKWFADGGDGKLRFNYDLKPDSIVLDLGGYRGDWSSELFSRMPCQIHVFEPVPEFYKIIQSRFAKNPHIKVHPFGLAGDTRQEKISQTAESSSIFGSGKDKITIQLYDIADWIQNNLPSDRLIDLLKINIEGAEYELLERIIDCGLTLRFKNLQIQFHNLFPDAETRMTRIQNHLHKTHHPKYQYKFVWEDWRLKSMPD